MAAHELKLRLAHLALLGVPVGYLTGIVVSTGPLTAPIFLAAGLVKGAFIAKRFVLKMDPERFRLLMDGLLLLSGLTLLWAAFF